MEKKEGDMKGKEEEKRRKRREIRRFEKRKQNAVLVSVTSVRKEKTQRKNYGSEYRR